MEKVLEFNGASACQSEPAEGKGGERRRAPSGTKAVCDTVLTVKKKKTCIVVLAETFSRSPRAPTQGCNYKSPLPSPVKGRRAQRTFLPNLPLF